MSRSSQNHNNVNKIQWARVPWLHTNVHGNRSTGSKVEDFQVFYHIWAWKPSDHVTNIISTYFHFLVPKFLQKQDLILIC